jgi:hypothetical protein
VLRCACICIENSASDGNHHPHALGCFVSRHPATSQQLTRSKSVTAKHKRHSHTSLHPPPPPQHPTINHARRVRQRQVRTRVRLCDGQSRRRRGLCPHQQQRVGDRRTQGPTSSTLLQGCELFQPSSKLFFLRPPLHPPLGPRHARSPLGMPCADTSSCWPTCMCVCLVTVPQLLCPSPRETSSCSLAG